MRICGWERMPDDHCNSTPYLPTEEYRKRYEQHTNHQTKEEKPGCDIEMQDMSRTASTSRAQ